MLSNRSTRRNLPGRWPDSKMQKAQTEHNNKPSPRLAFVQPPPGLGFVYTPTQGSRTGLHTAAPAALFLIT